MSCTPGRTRTDTGLILSQLPLPIGLRGLYQGIYSSLPALVRTGQVLFYQKRKPFVKRHSILNLRHS